MLSKEKLCGLCCVVGFDFIIIEVAVILYPQGLLVGSNFASPPRKLHACAGTGREAGIHTWSR